MHFSELVHYPIASHDRRKTHHRGEPLVVVVTYSNTKLFSSILGCFCLHDIVIVTAYAPSKAAMKARVSGNSIPLETSQGFWGGKGGLKRPFWFISLKGKAHWQAS
ncbi:hypothetical protein Nepgr_025701 [Nepenthes gracilis]|uniref:Uncharacterized protein n=1 Tax=Nepenthes gracilis TaxID=150966 RepID=A0AAD3T6T6_NEPGR|nr:hypothetical protein Nepgr_025701 [Nepenthes gracilis]